MKKVRIHKGLIMALIMGIVICSVLVIVSDHLWGESAKQRYIVRDIIVSTHYRSTANSVPSNYIICGKVLVWDSKDFFGPSDIYYKLPECIRAKSSDTNITVFILDYEGVHVKVLGTTKGYYRVQVTIIDWPSKKIIGDECFGEGCRYYFPFVQGYGESERLSHHDKFDEIIPLVAIYIMWNRGVIDRVIEEEGVNTLIYSLKDIQRISEASEIIAESGGEKAVEPLTQALNDENKSVRKIAELALKNIQK